MFNFRKSKSKNNPLLKKPRDDERYAEERELMRSDKVAERMKLAKSEKTHQEILYYMAENDEDENVRKAVAKNLMTPVQASTIIARDECVDVRIALIKRLSNLLPDLTADEYSQLYAHAVQALSMLALDEVLKVRKALVSSLKDKAYCPPKVAAALAKDLEREISEPILKYCVALPDIDLIDILRATKNEWVARAIAMREQINSDVSKAVIDRSDDFPHAGEELLKNKGAKIDHETMGYIIEKAKTMPAWQKSLGHRRDLPPDMVQKISKFVGYKLRKKIQKNNKMDQATAMDVEDAAKRRMNFFTDEAGKKISPTQKLQQLIRENKLDEEAVSDALAMNEKEFVIGALAHLANVKPENAAKMVMTKAPKAVVALSWRAKLSMRFAVELQKQLAKIPPKELIYPKSGQAYPLSEDAMLFQLDYFEDA